MLAIMISRNVSNRNHEQFPKCQQLQFSRTVDKYNFPKYWQLYFPEMLAIIFVRNAGGKCYHSFFSRKWRRMLTVIVSRNVRHYQFPEWLAIEISRNTGNYIFRNISKYIFQKCQQQVLANSVFENIGGFKTYNFRKCQQL